MGKVTLAHFDGSDECTTRAWAQKFYNYLALRPMSEDEAIRFATLHLDGIEHEWWYHGLVTLGHYLITTYNEFTNELIERFDKRDLELHLTELTQLKQYGSLDTYMAEFQILLVMVPRIIERRLVVIFSEGIMEPIRGWVKAFDSASL